MNAGHEGYIVGGAVRDLILGIKPKDFDILTSASPQQVGGVLKAKGRFYLFMIIVFLGESDFNTRIFGSNFIKISEF